MPNSKIQKLLTLSATVLVVATALPALGATGGKPRRPFQAPGERRTSGAVIDRYEQPFEIVRERTEMKKWAIFSAEPQAIERGAVMVFEAVSVSSRGSVPRWRCVAIHDVAECLGSPLKLRYLPGDHRIVLRVSLKPKETATPLALLGASEAPELFCVRP